LITFTAGRMGWLTLCFAVSFLAFGFIHRHRQDFFLGGVRKFVYQLAFSSFQLLY
jgi:hypothetical protein